MFGFDALVFFLLLLLKFVTDKKSQGALSLLEIFIELSVVSGPLELLYSFAALESVGELPFVVVDVFPVLDLHLTLPVEQALLKKAL